MADTSQNPLTVEAAKQNLREAAGAMTLGNYVKRHPYQSLGLSFILGMLLADNRRARALLLDGHLLDVLRLLQ